MKKPISFKTAFIIVILMHVGAFFLFAQLAAIRTHLSRIAWQERKEGLLKESSNNSANDWPHSNHTTNPVVTKIPAQQTAIKPPTADTIARPKQFVIKTEVPRSSTKIKIANKPESVRDERAERQKAIEFLSTKKFDTPRPTPSPTIVSSTQITRVGNTIEKETVERTVVRTNFVDSNNNSRQVVIIPIY